MEINLATPSLLFPAISLLLLAYTNRFLALANLIRSLHDRYRNQPNALLLKQIHMLRRRVQLIQYMQQLGVGSLLLCVVCMFALFAGGEFMGTILFACSLILMALSLGVSLREIQLSTNALNLELSGVEETCT